MNFALSEESFRKFSDHRPNVLKYSPLAMIKNLESRLGKAEIQHMYETDLDLKLFMATEGYYAFGLYVRLDIFTSRGESECTGLE